MLDLEFADGALGAGALLLECGDSTSMASGEQLGCASLISAATDCTMLDSEHSSAETLPVKLSVTARCSDVCDALPSYGHSPSHVANIQCEGTLNQISSVSDKPASPSALSIVLPVRKGQGYRRLWQAVSKVQHGQKLTDTHASREDVTVEDLVKTVQQLPTSASAIEAILPGLAYLDSRATAALLKGLSKAGLGQRAVEIFDYLRGLDHDDDLHALCDIFTYTTMISQCNSHHQLRRALELVAEMRSQAVPLNVHTYSALLNVCLKANELDLSMDVYAQMLQEGCTPNLVTYNTLLDIYNKAGRWMDALNVLELLQHQSIKPEARTYNAIIQTCNNAGRYLEAVRVHKVMLAAGVEPNGATFNAALSSYARSGQLESALALFNMMAVRGYERGTNTYAAVLTACELPGRWDVASELLQQMQMEGVRPTTACVTSAISACMHGGQPQRAEQLFDRMCTICKPDATTYNCLVCVYCRLGKLQEAVNMLEVMLRGGQHVNFTTYDVVVDACWATGVVLMQKYALQLFAKARQQGLYKVLVAQQVQTEGPVLDIQLPSGSPHVVLIGLLHMMVGLKQQYSTLLLAQQVTRVVLRLAMQGHDATSLSSIIETQLRALKSPFVAVPTVMTSANGVEPYAQAAAVEELKFVADSVSVADWLCGSQVTTAVSMVSLSTVASCSTRVGMAGPTVDGMLAAQEDATRGLECSRAMVLVQAYERACNIKAQNIPKAVLLHRGELVQLILRSAPILGLNAEVSHDAVQQLDRVLASGLACNVPGSLLAASCLHLASRRDINGLQLLAQLVLVSPQELLLMVQQVQQLMGGNRVSISALRVLRLYLERLGIHPEDAATPLVCGQALAIMNRAVLNPAFIGCPPSVMAMSVLYACRVAAGLLPAWPSALVTLTGYTDTEALQPYIEAAVQLLTAV